MKRVALTLIAVTLAATGCGGTDGGSGTTVTSSSSSTTLPGGERTLIIRIDEEGGFAPVEFSLNRLPRFTLYSDGTLYYQGPVDAVFPGPALPNIQTAAIGAQGLEDVMELVVAMDLASIDELIDDNAAANVADATTTLVTYFDDAGEHRYGVYALGFVEAADPLARHLENLLTVLDTYASQSPSADYTAERMQLLVGEGGGFDPQFLNVQPWAFDFDPTRLQPAILDLSCTMIEGVDTIAAYEFFSAANQATMWETEDGRQWRVLPRPLLPDETGCVFGT